MTKDKQEGQSPLGSPLLVGGVPPAPGPRRYFNERLLGLQKKPGLGRPDLASLGSMWPS
jgi:hypothetical protein